MNRFEATELRIDLLNSVHEATIDSKDPDYIIEGIDHYYRLLKEYYPNSFETEIYTNEFNLAKKKRNVKDLKSLFNKFYSILYKTYTEESPNYRKKKTMKPKLKIKCKCKK